MILQKRRGSTFSLPSTERAFSPPPWPEFQWKDAFAKNRADQEKVLWNNQQNKPCSRYRKSCFGVIVDNETKIKICCFLIVPFLIFEKGNVES